MDRRLGHARRWMAAPFFAVLSAGCVSLGNSAADASLDGIAERKQALVAMGDPKFADRSHPKFRSYDILAATAFDGCGPQARPAYIAALSSMQEGSTADEPIEMFSLPPLVRYLYRYGHCLDEAQKQQLLAGLTKRQRLTGHGTLNHAAMRVTSWYLLAQYFPNATWVDWDNKTYGSHALMDRLKPLLAARTYRFFASGQYELVSPVYALINLFPMLNMAEFARDVTVRQRAEDEVVLLLAGMKVNSFHGVLAPPLTRKNVDQRNATDWPRDYSPAIAQHALWYYFGEPASLETYDFQSRREPFYAAMLATSAWRPPDALLALGRSSPEGYSVKTVTPTFAIWDGPARPEIYGDAYIAEDFAVSTGNVEFDPAGYADHMQTFSILLKSDKPENQIECYQPYFRSNLGEDAWSTDRWSPFQQMYRYDTSSVIMLFDIPEADPWVYGKDNRFFAARNERKDALLQTIQCRIPRSFDEVVKEANWVFARHGGVYVAMATLKGLNEYDKAPSKLTDKFHIAKVREARSAMFFRVERARPDLSFAQFQATVRSQAPTYDPQTSSASFTDKSGVQTVVQFELKAATDGKRVASLPRVLRDGKPMLRDADAVIDSPLVSLRGGVLAVGAGPQALRIDRSVRP
jgi:hypothetical protein